MIMKKILFLTNIPSPYRVDFFNELGKYVELTVVFEKRKSDERDESWNKKAFENFHAVFLDGIKITVNKAFCPSVKRVIKENCFDLIICSNYATPTGVLAVDYMIRHNIPYAIEGDGAILKKCSLVKKIIKKRTVKNAIVLFSTSKFLDEYFRFFGAEPEKIFRYHFSSMKQEDILGTPISYDNKMNIRKKLEINEQHIVVTVGQFIYRKGFDILLKAAKSFDDTYGFYFIGGKPTEEYKELVSNLKLNNVHFVGFKEKEELKDFFCAADVFAFPTREDIWGLVVNEAMGYGLPIVSTKRCIAATEMINNECGYIINIDSVEELVESINKLFSHDLYQAGCSSIQVANEYTIEKMCEDHLKIIDDIIT